ncbi:MAG: DUF1830 domain-containing protein [Cyanobacteria bacterium J06621_11]
MHTSHRIICCYTNTTTRIQIIKIPSTSDRFFERTVMPYGTVLFEAEHTAHLEVHTSEIMGAILSDVIPCAQLVRSACQKCERTQKSAA